MYRTPEKLAAKILRPETKLKKPRLLGQWWTDVTHRGRLMLHTGLVATKKKISHNYYTCITHFIDEKKLSCALLLLVTINESCQRKLF